MNRGRPKGSKNKPKEIKKTSLEIKRIKKEIKDLKAKKLSLPSGSRERIELHRKIKETKVLLTQKKEIKTQKENLYNNPEKDKLIQEIKKLDPLFVILKIDLKKFTVEQLQYHLDKKKRGLKNA